MFVSPGWSCANVQADLEEEIAHIPAVCREREKETLTEKPGRGSENGQPKNIRAVGRG